MASGRLLDFDTAQLSALVANFYAADRDVKAAAQALVERSGDAMIEIAQTISPVDTGFMRDHIRKRVTEQGMAVSIGWESADFEEAGLQFYPPYVELGTMRMTAQPTIWPAYDEVAPQFEQELSDLCSAAIERRISRSSGGGQ
jgi:HK97 gp10 family phage protein